MGACCEPPTGKIAVKNAKIKREPISQLETPSEKVSAEKKSRLNLDSLTKPQPPTIKIQTSSEIKVKSTEIQTAINSVQIQDSEV